MAPIKVSRPPDVRIWLDPIPRLTWEYEQSGRFSWWGDWGPSGLRHQIGFHAYTERGIRRKLARMIRKERRRRFLAYTTKVQS